MRFKIFNKAVWKGCFYILCTKLLNCYSSPVASHTFTCCNAIEHFEKAFNSLILLFCLDAKSSKKMESVEALAKIGAEKLQRKKSKANAVIILLKVAAHQQLNKAVYFSLLHAFEAPISSRRASKAFILQ